MNVPKIVRKNVTMTSVTFQTRSMLRRSCTITECRNAVAVNHGSSAGVLDRIPAPVAAPAELLVRPDHAEHEAERQEQPANIVQRRTARSHESSRCPVIERRHAERERNRHADEARVERRRMDHHPVVLQQRVQPVAVGGRGR